MTRLLAILLLSLACLVQSRAVPFSFWQNPAAPAAGGAPDWHFWKLGEGDNTTRLDTATGTQPLLNAPDGVIYSTNDTPLPDGAHFDSAFVTYLGTSNELTISNTFMIWGWLRPGSALNMYAGAHGDWAGEAEANSFVLQPTDGTDLYLRFRDSVGANCDASTPFAFGGGESIFFAAGYDGTQSLLYTNGVLAASNTFTRGASLTAPFLIGTDTNLGNGYIGAIDAVGFTNGAPTQAQVDYWYNSGSGREFP